MIQKKLGIPTPNLNSLRQKHATTDVFKGWKLHLT